MNFEYSFYSRLDKTQKKSFVLRCRYFLSILKNYSISVSIHTCMNILNLEKLTHNLAKDSICQ